MWAERVRWCKGDGYTGVGDGGDVVVVSAGCEFIGGIRGSGIVSIADDVLEMSVVSGVGEVCMCLARDGVGCLGAR